MNEQTEQQIKNGIVEPEACRNCGKHILTDNGYDQLEAHITADQGFDAGEFSGRNDYYSEFCQCQEEFCDKCGKSSFDVEVKHYTTQYQEYPGACSQTEDHYICQSCDEDGHGVIQKPIQENTRGW